MVIKKGVTFYIMAAIVQQQATKSFAMRLLKLPFLYAKLISSAKLFAQIKPPLWLMDADSMDPILTVWILPAKTMDISLTLDRSTAQVLSA